MQDIRLQEIPYIYGDKTFMLRINMNVLADLQETYGEIPDPLDGQKSLKNFTIYLSAMMNDYADEMGWSERFTPKQIGRTTRVDPKIAEDIMLLVCKAIYSSADSATEKNESKN